MKNQLYQRRFITPAFLLVFALFCVASLTAIPYNVMAATRVFYDGFESGNTSLWRQVDLRNRCTVVASPGDGGAAPQSGSRIAQCNWNGTVEWNDPASYETMAFPSVSGNELFFRVYIRVSPNMTSTGAGGDNTGPKLLRFFSLSGYEAYLGMEQVNPGTDPAWVGWIHDTPTPGNHQWYMGSLSRSAWTKLEMYFNRATNLHRIWINDALIRDVATYDVSGVTDAPLYLGSNWSGVAGTRVHDAVNHVYWDEMEVYTDSASGTPATGNMENGDVLIGGTSAPTFTFTANPTSITSDASSILSWSVVTNATSCTASGGAFTGSKSVGGGTQLVSPITMTTYTLSCVGAGGTTNRSVTVTVGGNGKVLMNECNSTQSEWVFCNDFDTGVTADSQRRAQWDDYDGATDVNFIVNSGPSKNGTNHVAQFRAPAGERGGADLVKELPSSYDRLYSRWYIQYEPGFNFSAPNHGGGLHAGSRNLLGQSGNRPNGSDWFSSWVEYDDDFPHSPYFYSYYRGMYQDCSNPSGSCWGDSLPCVYGSGYCTKPQHLPSTSLPDLQAGQWYCVEMLLDGGTPTQTELGANGAAALWLDGESVGSFNDLWLRTAPNLKISLLWLSLFHHDGTHSVGGALYDNVVVSTSRIGCGDPPSSDTTPPTSPTNLAATSPSQSSISVSWTASTDNVGVTSYIVERCQGAGCTNFTQVGTPTAPPFVDSGLTANTFYNYHVRARDAAGNQSGWSNVVGATTITSPTELIIDNTDSTVSQSGSWSPSTNFPGYYGANYHYSPNQSGEWFEWQATGLTAGTYQVFAYWNANADRPTDVSYRITHSGGTTTINNINQTQNGSQWNLLGTYTFGTTGTVRVISGATGAEGTVADAVRFVRTNTISCNTVTTSNFSQSTYDSYGAPFDAFQTSTNLMNANCSSSDPHTIQATLGQMGDTTRIVYTKGYYYANNAWTQYSGTCTGALNGDWCQGSVSAMITNPNISTASASAPAYFVGMTCSVQGGGWKCGCRDATCGNFYWQVQGAGQ